MRKKKPALNICAEKLDYFFKLKGVALFSVRYVVIRKQIPRPGLGYK